MPGTEFTLPADLVLLAMGFVHVVHDGLVEELGLQARRPRQRGRRRLDDQRSPASSPPATRCAGASLVVHAINQGRLMAAAVDKWLRRS